MFVYFKSGMQRLCLFVCFFCGKILLAGIEKKTTGTVASAKRNQLEREIPPPQEQVTSLQNPPCLQSKINRPWWCPPQERVIISIAFISLWYLVCTLLGKTRARSIKPAANLFDNPPSPRAIAKYVYKSNTDQNTSTTKINRIDL
uniref:Putative secreted protein n=1 Tax=Ixodes ricinus TaxID=34613 RepID=A0A6B0UUL9_IXORI